MTLTVTHNKVNSAAANPNVQVDSAAWNDSHKLQGTIDVSQGGTGQASLAANYVIIGNGTAPVGSVAGVAGNSNLPLVSQGDGLPPIYKTIPINGAISNLGTGVGTALTNAVTGTSGGVVLQSGPTIIGPQFSGTISGIYTLAGTLTITTPSITGPTITGPQISGTVNGTYTLGGTPTITGLTSINKVAITAPATGATLTIADGKTLTASNTLTLSGTDGVTIPFGTRTQQVFTSGSGTYTKPANVKYIVVRMVGGGGGGGGSGSGGGNGTAGNNTTFSTFTASGGSAGQAGGLGGSGGAASGGTNNFPGTPGLLSTSFGTAAGGGSGGSAPFFGGGGIGGSIGPGPGGAGATNSGGGGGGAGVASGTGAGGGGSGGFVEALITSPAATYSYAVGGTAAGGAAGTSGAAGGAGAAGRIIVDEFYQ